MLNTFRLSGRPPHKTISIVLFCILVVVLCEFVLYSDIIKTQFGERSLDKYTEEELKDFLVDQYNLRHHKTVTEYFEKRKNWVTSQLGTILFKGGVEPPQRNQTFNVLIWKHWKWLKQRHVVGFGRERSEILSDCSVKNCLFTGDDKQLSTADAVVVHIQHGEYPRVENRNPDQRWIFLSDESPMNSFSMALVKPRLEDWANVFNWSMTFRSDADVPVPYGRTVPLPFPQMENTFTETISEHVPNWEQKKRDVAVGILMSNCGVSERNKYLQELQNYIEVDVHGKCSKNNKNTCPGHFRADCKAIGNYLFYLVLENSKCRQYLTEKVFHNAYAKGSIPIIYGPPLEDCEKLLPPNSFLHVDNYESPKHLAMHIKMLRRTNTSLLAFHQWRNNFEVLNEHGYFDTKSNHYCRVCEALNYNDEKRKQYSASDLELFLNPKLLCEK